MQITIQIDYEADLELIFAFLQRMGAKIIEQKNELSSLSPIYWLETLAQQGGIQSIADPSEWQRQIRQDKPLPFREI
jgi:hypothetical protein